MALVIKDLLKVGENRLEQAGCMDPKVDAELLFCHMTGLTRPQIFMKWSETMGDAQCDHYFNLLEIRASGVPLQHITGHQEFMGFDFDVDENVLIPRQDTENLAEEVIRMVRARGEKKVKILDLCTGSGALAISIFKFLEGALELPSEYVEDEEEARRKRIYEMLQVSNNETLGRQHAVMASSGKGDKNGAGAGGAGNGAGNGVAGNGSAKKAKISVEMTGSDVSEAALGVAKKNAAKIGAKVNFVKGDLLEPFRKKLGGNRRFDYIVTNPPYIPSAVIPTLQVEVKDHEPMLALDGGADGLNCYRRIISEAPAFLNEGGVLLMEIGHDQAEAISGLVAEAANAAEMAAAASGKRRKKDAPYFSGVEILKDYAGHDRVAILAL